MRKTKTRSFGASKREGHDASAFYNRKLYTNQQVNPTLLSEENSIDDNKLDRIRWADSRSMDLPDNSIHLMITSPPYNVGKEYDEDLSLHQYGELLKEVFSEVYRVLVPGGRACINVANIGRKPYIPLHSLIIQEMLSLGYLMRGEIIWNKSASSGGSCAWGSWKSASNPTLRDVHEYILVFSKGQYGRKKLDRQDTISRDEFLELTKSIWEFPAASAKKVGHPAPFPIELPYRLIQLYSFKGDVVLDPFCGSGSTCLAAVNTGRRYIGYDIHSRYVRLSQERLAQERVTVSEG